MRKWDFLHCTIEAILSTLCMCIVETTYDLPKFTFNLVTTSKHSRRALNAWICAWLASQNNRVWSTKKRWDIFRELVFASPTKKLNIKPTSTTLEIILLNAFITKTNHSGDWGPPYLNALLYVEEIAGMDLVVNFSLRIIILFHNNNMV